MRSEFYQEAVFLDGELHKNVCVFTIKHGVELVSFSSLEHDHDTLTVYTALLAIAQSHRGAKLASCVELTIEKVGRAMGAELVWAVAALKHPMSQHLMEQLKQKTRFFGPTLRI